MRSMKYLTAIAAVGLSIATVGCAKKETPAKETPAPVAVEVPMAEGQGEEVVRARAEMEMGVDRVSAGSVMFEKEAGGVRVTAHIVGAPPGTHGLHIHDVGDCSADDFTSAGGHFNPTGDPHGGPDDAVRHAGDLGNIVIGEDGSGHLELVSAMINLGGGDDSAIGRGVILHANADDLVSQPTGAAGARIACGVVVPVEGA